MIFVIRHGERSDQVIKRDENQIQLKYDPPITELGKKQSFVTGHVIQSLVNEGYEKGLIKTSKPEYIIVSSPFLRCLQTAYHLAESLDKNAIYKDTIFYEEGIGEFLGDNLFDDHVLQKLYIRSRSEDEVKQKIPYKLSEGFVNPDKHIVYPKYPENAVIGFDRVKACYSGILEHYMHKINLQSDKVLVIVTHAFGIYSVLQAHIPLFFNDTGTEYGTINQIVYDEEAKGKGRVLLKLYDKHISNASIKPSL